MEGLAYRVVPYEMQGDMFGSSGMNSDIMYENLVNKFRWGGVENKNLYLDENVLRMLGNFRSTFARLSLQLIAENKPDSARKALNKCLQVIPDEVVPFNVYNILLVEAFYKLGDFEKANAVVNKIKSNVYNDMNYFVSLGKKYSSYLIYEKRIAFYTMDELRRLGETYNQPELKKEMDQRLSEYSSALNIAM
jgi:tetratricopeptide (TPR) repeat protein